MARALQSLRVWTLIKATETWSKLMLVWDVIAEIDGEEFNYQFDSTSIKSKEDAIKLTKIELENDGLDYSQAIFSVSTFEV